MNDLTLQERLQSMEQGGAAAREQTLDIVEYWRAIAKRRWSILALTVAVAVMTFLIVSAMRPSYRSTVTLLIEQGKNKVVSIEEVYSSGMIQREYYQTQVEILKSEELARKVVQKLKLTSHPDFDPRQKEATWLSRLNPFKDEKEHSDADILKSVVSAFKKDLQVQLVRNSQLAQMSFIAHDRELSAKVPNALAETFIESDLDSRMAMTHKAAEWLRERMGELRSKVDTAEKALQDYRDRERIVDTKGLVLSGAGKQLEELTRSLVEARQKRAETESAFALVQQIKAGRTQITYESIPAVLRHPLFQKMKEQEADADRRLSDAAKRYGPEHPKMVQARAEL